MPMKTRESLFQYPFMNWSMLPLFHAAVWSASICRMAASSFDCAEQTPVSNKKQALIKADLSFGLGFMDLVLPVNYSLRLHFLQ